MTETFSGFPAAGIGFFRDLKKNNHRDWFNANKKRYIETVQEPTQLFVEELGRRLQKLEPSLQYDSRAGGSGSMMRIHRDTRFSKDKTPYKTDLALVIWMGPNRKKTENAGFYFRWGLDRSHVYAGIRSFDRDQLAAYRAAVASPAGDQLATIQKSVARKKGYEFGGSHYKKVPRGFDPDHPHAELLKFNGLWILSPAIAPETVTSASVVNEVVKHCRATMTLNHWIVEHVL